MSQAHVLPHAQADRELMRQLREGNHTALERLYRRYSRLVYTLIVRIVRDRQESEDVLEEVFFEVWRAAERFDESRGSVQAYLVTLARSRAIDRLRRRDGTGANRVIVRTAGDSTREPAIDADPASDADRAERCEQVKAALASLEPATRELIERSFYEGKSHSEIAAETGKPLGSVKTQIRRGLLTLAKVLKTVKSIVL